MKHFSNVVRRWQQPTREVGRDGLLSVIREKVIQDAEEGGLTLIGPHLNGFAIVPREHAG